MFCLYLLDEIHVLQIYLFCKTVNWQTDCITNKDLSIYLSIRFYNSFRRLPETKRHSSLFLQRIKIKITNKDINKNKQYNKLVCV
jgi:hypothetical protein